jgi:hypothetical protein
MDPIHIYNGHWWFWDATGTQRYGPHTSYRWALAGCRRYTDFLQTYMTRVLALRPDGQSEGADDATRCRTDG